MKGKKMSGFPAREKALNDFFAAWEPRMQTELAALEEAVGRVAAEDLYSVNTLPVYRKRVDRV